LEKLNDEHIDLIQQYVKRELGNDRGLSEEMLDHLCILIELEMQQGTPFASALETAFNGLDHNALRDIRYQELVLRYADPRLIKALFAAIVLCLLLAISYWIQQVRGFRMFSLIALVLATYFLLPLLALRRWYKSQARLQVLVMAWLGVIQLHSLIFIVIRPFRWRAGLFFFFTSLAIGLFYHFKNQRSKD
jgi:hypothetical protein